MEGADYDAYRGLMGRCEVKRNPAADEAARG
jgi:hypothetical protein